MRAPNDEEVLAGAQTQSGPDQSADASRMCQSNVECACPDRACSAQIGMTEIEWWETPKMLMMVMLLPGGMLGGYGGDLDGVNGSWEKARTGVSDPICGRVAVPIGEHAHHLAP